MKAKTGSILINLANLSAAKIADLLKAFPDPNALLGAQVSDLRRISSLPQQDIDKLLSLRSQGVLENELALIEKHKITCLDLFSQEYPLLLKEIANPPIVLYLKGDPKVLNQVSFAIVGSRKATWRGLAIAKKYAAKLSQLGMVIVSGLARGIDSGAHQGAISQGLTIAVLGSGLLNIYPRENVGLAREISQNGAVISEFPLLAKPLPENFPRRNRIVSGLSKGVLVVEAAARSGALITARLACEQNRDVFAIPGGIDSSLSKGPHKIIKEGAKLVDSFEDIIEELNLNLGVAHE